jgi:threonine/homoserine efflux transporter RhtA
VATAVVFRSGVTALVMAVLVLLQGVPVRFTPRHRRVLPVIGLLIGLQSLCLYSAVARLPVALALAGLQHLPDLHGCLGLGAVPRNTFAGAWCVRCR